MGKTSIALMRSKLFVPGSRPELFAKALGSVADALSFDLEDAVAPSRKAEARQALAGFLRGPEAQATDKLLIVRVNGLASGLFAADVAAMVGPGLDVINLPMVESPADILAAVIELERIEAAAGLPPTPILANIETPRGLRQAAGIATAHKRVCGLQIGFGDLFEPHGIDRRNLAALDGVRLQIRMAGAEAGIPVFDGALAAVADLDFCRQEAEASRALGYAGKSCIHPTQIAVVNAVFVPRPKEIARALKALAATREQMGAGVGAFVVDGEMFDAPFIASAQALVDRAAALGLLPDQAPSA